MFLCLVISILAGPCRWGPSSWYLLGNLFYLYLPLWVPCQVLSGDMLVFVGCIPISFIADSYFVYFQKSMLLILSTEMWFIIKVMTITVRSWAGSGMLQWNGNARVGVTVQFYRGWGWCLCYHRRYLNIGILESINNNHIILYFDLYYILKSVPISSAGTTTCDDI